MRSFLVTHAAARRFRRTSGRRSAMTLSLAVSALVACSSAETSGSRSGDGGGAHTGPPDGPAPDSPAPDADPGSDSAGIGGPCGYPMAEGFDIGQVVPDLSWTGAFRGDGTTLDFDLEDVHCSPAWDHVETIHFVVTTGWCPNCPNYIDYVDSLAAQIEAEGGLVVFLTTEDRSGNGASNAYSHSHVGEYASNGSGIRVGDAEADPPMQVAASPTIEFVPTSFVVRRSDMRVIADQRASEYTLPFVEIAAAPELDWGEPGAPTVQPELPSNCGPEDEEVYEPNNRVADAKAIRAGSFSGGICDSNPDFFAVDIDGRWSLYLEFEHEVGDLDVYVWDPDTQRAAVDSSGAEIGSYGTDDGEYFEHLGPAVIYVHGYGRQTAPYTLLITAL